MPPTYRCNEYIYARPSAGSFRCMLRSDLDQKTFCYPLFLRARFGIGAISTPEMGSGQSGKDAAPATVLLRNRGSWGVARALRTVYVISWTLARPFRAMERIMNPFDFDQCMEEIQLSLAQVFDSQKRPTVSLINEGDVIVLHLSRATESGRSTLDARCPATQRRTIQARIGTLVRGRVDLMRESTAFSAASSIEFVLDDALFDTFDSVGDLDYRPALRAHAAPFHHEHDAAHRLLA